MNKRERKYIRWNKLKKFGFRYGGKINTQQFNPNVKGYTIVCPIISDKPRNVGGGNCFFPDDVIKSSTPGWHDSDKPIRIWHDEYGQTGKVKFNKPHKTGIVFFDSEGNYTGHVSSEPKTSDGMP